MQYLSQINDIRAQIAQFALAQVLWLDTEVADWWSNQPRLSLIQVSTNMADLTGQSVYILDVLDQPDLITQFIHQVIVNPQVEKVFHNASYDLRFLGKEQAQNVTCTLKMAQKIGKQSLKVSNLKLKTLATELCHFSEVDPEEQNSDWGQRALTQKQLLYATMDVVYLAAVHQRLLNVLSPSQPHNSALLSTKQPMAKPDALSFSATKVRIALECPRLFYLHHQFGSRPLFLPPDAAMGIGNIFHHLADEFVQLALKDQALQTLFRPLAEQLQVEEIAIQMQQRFYRLIFAAYLQKTAQTNPEQAAELLRVWQGLQHLIKRFAELLILNRGYCEPEAFMSSTFITADRSVMHHFQLPNGNQQRVAGEFDCLVYNFQLQRLAVVEFKTYQPVDPSAQLAQVALYSYMLWVQQNVPIDSAVYCVLPDFKEYHYSWEQLENTVHQLIPHKLQQMQQWINWQPGQPEPPPPTPQPHLCQICPQYQKCQSFFIDTTSEPISLTQASDFETAPEQSSVQAPVQTAPPDQLAADTLADQLVTTLQSFKVGVEYQGFVAAPAFIRVKLKPSLGVKVGTILKLSDDLRVQLGLTYPPLIAPQAGYVSIDLPRPDRQAAVFEQYLQPQTLPSTAPICIAVGIDLEGQLIEANLSDPNTCHFLVGGTTGSGKSEFLRSMLLSLLVRHSPNHLKIALVDPKRVTFPEFENMPWLYQPIVKESEQAIDLMENLVAEMAARYQKFEINRCNDLSSYNQKQIQHPEKILPRIVCIFDEYADFIAEKTTAKILELSIKRLGAMARAAGIHLIIATQRPEAKIVTPIIRSNLPGRVALRTASEADSMIILGGKQTEAAYLLGKGDLLYQAGASLVRLQSLFAPDIKLSKI